VVDLEKIEDPKQMLWVATLWEKVVPQEEIPEDLNNVHTCSKKLVEVLRVAPFRHIEKPISSLLP
jgi:hypothetical protein